MDSIDSTAQDAWAAGEQDSGIALTEHLGTAIIIGESL
jgi:hypothetical protein